MKKTLINEIFIWDTNVNAIKRLKKVIPHICEGIAVYACEYINRCRETINGKTIEHEKKVVTILHPKSEWVKFCKKNKLKEGFKTIIRSGNTS